MLRIILIVTVVSLLIVATSAQEKAGTKASVRGSSNVTAETKGTGNSTEIASGTQVSAELISAIDAHKAKPGDEVKLRVIKPVTVGGKRVINKGAVLLGRVTEATKAEGKQGVSQVRLAFNELRHRDVTLPFSATLQQITRANIQSNLDDDATMQTSTRSTTRASAQSSGGLLGGVGGTVNNTLGGVVGGVTDTTLSTVSNVAGTSRQTLGQVIAVSSDTVNTTAGKASGLILISSETSAQSQSSSTLSATGRDVKIEKGAVFLLRTDKALAITAQR